MSILKVKDENGNVIDIPTIRGKSAYEYAVEGGYSGTEEEFAEKMNSELPSKQEIVDSILNALPTWQGGAY